jgi:hypothetical protein
MKERLAYFKPDVAKAMCDHFVSLGLDAHLGIKAWDEYCAERTAGVRPPELPTSWPLDEDD